jgi:peroxiredoxin
MEFIYLSLILLWCLVVFNLHLTLTMTRRVNALYALFEKRSELSIGAPAPDFEAETLEGDKVTLATYLGRKVVFIFIDPHCGPCRREIPSLEMLGPIAKKNSNVDFVVVSEGMLVDSRQLKQEYQMSLPVILAPRKRNDFAKDYNPLGITPYYCSIDEKGIVQSRSPLGKDDWFQMKRTWVSIDESSHFTSSLIRYT